MGAVRFCGDDHDHDLASLLRARTDFSAAPAAWIRWSDHMRTMTATEASRTFAAVLDEAERGQTVVTTRGGRRIATIGAARDAVELEGPAWPDD